MRRFFAGRGFNSCNPSHIATACIFLACKVEESHVQAHMFHKPLHRSLPGKLHPAPPDTSYTQPSPSQYNSIPLHHEVSLATTCIIRPQYLMSPNQARAKLEGVCWDAQGGIVFLVPFSHCNAQHDSSTCLIIHSFSHLPIGVNCPVTACNAKII